MFVLAVLSFISGVYLQAILQPPVVPPAIALFLLAAAVPFLFSRVPRTTAVVVLICFALAGGVRLGLFQSSNRPAEPGLKEAVYEGIIMESSPWVKIVRLTSPTPWHSIRVAYPTEAPLEIGQAVVVSGKLRELRPSFKNPHVGSWKDLRRLEGIEYELRGQVVLCREATGWLEVLRKRFQHNIDNSGAPHIDILKALTIGDRTSLTQEKRDLFLRTGTSHLLAISGFNVGIISGLFFFVIRWLLRRVPRLRLSGRDTRYAALAVIPFPFMFMVIAGTGVSVIRATIMVVIYMLALFFERGRHVVNTMALAALIILLIFPHSLFTPSFQLTFMSLLFIVLFAGRFYNPITRLRRGPLIWTASTVLSTAAATLGTVPIVLYYFHGINPFSVIHNIVSIPLVGVAATALAIIGMAVPLGHYLLTAAGFLTDVTLQLLTLLDFGYLYPLVRPDLIEVLLYYALTLSLLYIDNKPVVAAVIILVLPLSVFQAHRVHTMRYNENMRINFIDVGNGDSILIEAGNGRE